MGSRIGGGMGRKIMLAMAALLLSVFGLELYARSQPLQRVQNVLSLHNLSLRMVGNVPVWVSLSDDALQVANRDCIQQRSDSVDVLLLGDSIFFGVSLPAEDTLAPLLQRRLTASLNRPTCVVNLSQPGYTFENQEAVASEVLAAQKPRVVVLEIWHNSVHKYAMVDGDAYNFGSLQVDEWGLPNPGVPTTVNRLLFENTSIWRHVAVGFTKKAPSRDAAWSQFVKDQLEPFRQRLASHEIQLVLAYATMLNTPFSEGREKENQSYEVVKSWAAEHAIPEVMFSEVLAEESLSEIGIDACCHLSTKGTRLVAEALDPVLTESLSRATP